MKKEEENVVGKRVGGGREVAVLMLLLSLLSLLFAHHNTPFPILEVTPYYYLYANKIPAAYEFRVMIYMSENTPKNVSRGIKFFTLLRVHIQKYENATYKTAGEERRKSNKTYRTYTLNGLIINFI